MSVTFRRFENSRNVEVPPHVHESRSRLQRLERSVAIERLERLERLFSLMTTNTALIPYPFTLILSPRRPRFFSKLSNIRLQSISSLLNVSSIGGKSFCQWGFTRRDSEANILSRIIANLGLIYISTFGEFPKQGSFPLFGFNSPERLERLEPWNGWNRLWCLTA